MSFPDIDNAITKYLTNEADSSELDLLSKWIESAANQRYFDACVKTHYELTAAMKKPDVDELKNTLLKQIKKDKNPFYKYRIASILKYAAVILAVLGLTYLFRGLSEKSSTAVELTVQQQLVPKEGSITIELNNGTVQTIDPDGNSTIRDAKGSVIGNQNRSQLQYQGIAASGKLRYNTLHIPKGKRFEVILSDGTRVYLNADSSLKYPIQFVAGKPRDVFLEGEAYFDVTKQEGLPFTVHADDMNINVIGTKFNVSHYAQNDHIQTVLVEGSVALSQNRDDNAIPTMLTPGNKAQWNKKDNSTAIKKVDTRLYTAWMDGKLIFRNTAFKEIRQTLERHYNVTIKNKNKDLDSQLFDATFDIERIEEILEIFSKSYAIDYSIINNEVIIE